MPEENEAKRDLISDELLYKRPPGVLLDEKKWNFLRKRYHMTPRELQVAILVCRGFNNSEIAERLNIRHGTVKTHLRNIYRRTRVKSKITLLLRFVEDVSKYYETEGENIRVEEHKTEKKTEDERSRQR